MADFFSFFVFSDILPEKWHHTSLWNILTDTFNVIHVINVINVVNVVNVNVVNVNVNVNVVNVPRIGICLWKSFV